MLQLRQWSETTSQSYQVRSLTQFHAAPSPKRCKILDDGIKLVYELEAMFFQCKLPPVVESLRWVPTIAAFVLGDSLGEHFVCFARRFVNATLASSISERGDVTVLASDRKTASEVPEKACETLSRLSLPSYLPLAHWRYTASTTCLPKPGMDMYTLKRLLFALFLFHIFLSTMSGLFRCGEPCNRSFADSRGLSHHRNSCSSYLQRQMENRIKARQALGFKRKSGQHLLPDNKRIRISYEVCYC